MCGRLFPEYISAAALPRERCIILREDKLPRFDWRFAVMLALPYYVGGGDGTLAEFASHEDYHAVFARLETELQGRLRELWINANIRLMTDNSPLDEVKCAALAGLGVIGRHGMLITAEYSSYVFIGEMFTDLSAVALVRLGIMLPERYEISHCISCGSCIEACPGKKLGGEGICLSELTQKKRALTDDEAALVAASGCAWGCDVCSEVCPYTISAKSAKTIFTRHQPFLQDHVTGMSSERLAQMSDEEYSHFAFSWRPRRVMERNLELIEKQREKS